MTKRSVEQRIGLVDGAGFAAALWIAFESEVRAQGGSPLDIHRLVTAEGANTIRKMAQVVVRRGDCEIVGVQFPVWKSLTIGNHRGSYYAALEAGGYRISDQARQILAKMPIVQSAMVVHLVRITVVEMGFPLGATTPKIYAWAKEHGLKKCPAEVCPKLKLRYPDVASADDGFHFGMEPIADSEGTLRVFNLGRDGLSTDGVEWADSTGCWDPEHVWVFVREK